MSQRGDRGRSNEEYVVTIDGEPSDVLDRSRAMARGEYHGEIHRKNVQVHRLRKDRSSVLVAAWLKGKKTK